MRVVAVFVGGTLGTLARWGVGHVVPVSGVGFPVGTFGANVSGAFALGLVGVLLLERLRPARHVRLLLGVGFLGAYTTFSTMAVEGVRLVEAGSWRMAAGYWIATLVAGQMAGVYGMWLGRLRPRRRGRA
ncbi:MAG: fluoride efflux transporter CrcB [Streptosporangiales bacterium]|nr:fluoride efflux transporter CrcB [Streptosporangiales bacterium]